VNLKPLNLAAGLRVRCDGCRFWDSEALGMEPGKGLCHHHPHVTTVLTPVPPSFEQPQGGGLAHVNVTSWAKTNAEHWCAFAESAVSANWPAQ
jgi:hypothetical protein